MDLSLVADYLIVLFFLWYGLKRFVPALDKGVFSIIGAIIAILLAVFTLLDTI